MPKKSIFVDLKLCLQKKSQSEGFDDMRICRPWDVPHVSDKLNLFLDKGYHGQMNWLAERSNWRSDPSALWPEARSVIMLAQSYAPHGDPMYIVGERDKAAISVYARNKDYHDIVKKRLKAIARWLISEAGGDVKVFVDTAPVPEKPLGHAAGLGWQGKHTNLVSRKLGNWFFIGSVFTTLDLPEDSAEEDHCGSCTKCLTACPTDAFPAPYQLDARRCISYLTIEHKGSVAPELRGKLGNRIYGCDDCLAACPWNKFAQDAREVRYHARDDLIAPRLEDLVALNDSDFRQKFSGSPIKRIGRDRFVRNVLYAIGNSGQRALCTSAQNLCGDPDPIVAEAARWAVEKLTAGI
ncbi:tRNA epoxyqueuosine(34) reductase QueG [Paracoccaceae bacterium]|jgi:epoxyqueuosine reductase|nr:tRNA epoxyqueuosine(34) reductase QueG [Paracoccaceae bacterium]